MTFFLPFFPPLKIYFSLFFPLRSLSHTVYLSLMSYSGQEQGESNLFPCLGEVSDLLSTFIPPLKINIFPSFSPSYIFSFCLFIYYQLFRTRARRKQSLSFPRGSKLPSFYLFPTLKDVYFCLFFPFLSLLFLSIYLL